ncbi:MAG TPA: NADH-quinone oxidoreductase subunit M [Candidatus Binataceae bacterium]
MSSLILTSVVFLPLLGSLFVIISGGDSKSIWRSAFIFSLVPLGVSIYLVAVFDPAQSAYQFVEQYQWIPQFGISYHLGVDGISLFLVLLTTLLISISLWYSAGGDIEERAREFCFFVLLLETGLIGALLSLDLFLFYLFWELMLFPMYFLIGIWGHGNKIYAAIKFVLFTMFGSALMLVAIVYLAIAARDHFGSLTFDLPALIQVPLTVTESRWLFAAFALGFAIKVPMWPVHTWLPDAHTEAPTAGSVILAGIMLKMGTYGFLRFAIPLFPDVAVEVTPIFMALAVIGILYGAMVALVQADLKRLVAYSSVSHLGFVILGMFALNTQGVEGSIYQMLNHGLSTPALFLIVGMLYLRRHTHEISEFGGLWSRVPIMAALFMFAMLSSIGLPGLNGFIGEFLIMLGAFLHTWQAVAFAAFGTVLGALYLLYAYERVMWGELSNDKNKLMPDLDLREILSIVPLMALMLFMGFYPKPLLSRMEPSVNALLTRIHNPVARVESRSARRLATASPLPAKDRADQRGLCDCIFWAGQGVSKAEVCAGEEVAPITVNEAKDPAALPLSPFASGAAGGGVRS